MLNLGDYNHAHDGQIIQIDFDFDVEDFSKKQELRIKYRLSLEEQQAGGTYKTVGYDYFQMIFDTPSHFFFDLKTVASSFSFKEKNIAEVASYHYDANYIYEIVELERIANHYHWQIRMCGDEGCIDIYANGLKIEKIANPFPLKNC